MKDFTRKEEKEYRREESDLKKDIIEKLKLPQNKDKIVEANSKYLPPFIKMFDEKFLWKTDEYEMQISIEAMPEKAKIQKNYRFTLFESDEEELTKFKDDYKYGDVISWVSENHSGILVQITEA
ncbi:MAG: hypothetical protein V1739_10615 [Candidatus Omnitrophota bacterium]